MNWKLAFTCFKESMDPVDYTFIIGMACIHIFLKLVYPSFQFFKEIERAIWFNSGWVSYIVIKRIWKKYKDEV